ncbi:hypothetical protein TIFTF001_026327 [Ficus carica]|uniref:Uncharacterized protein n=1 Tax=Ficus carica TaxID=3494 RepID=A0AA88DL29_FICCA|nr:hypothetical protein TIFTF001_026327 [Ficus carica]
MIPRSHGGISSTGTSTGRGDDDGSGTSRSEIAAEVGRPAMIPREQALSIGEQPLMARGNPGDADRSPAIRLRLDGAAAIGAPIALELRSPSRTSGHGGDIFPPSGSRRSIAIFALAPPPPSSRSQPRRLRRDFAISEQPQNLLHRCTGRKRKERKIEREKVRSEEREERERERGGKSYGGCDPGGYRGWLGVAVADSLSLGRV